jgi:uncharacterized protein YecE (DUF72 family)
MDKTQVIERLLEMADLLEITDANVFEMMAHRNAARSLEDWWGDLEEAVQRGTLTEIPAIGKGLARVVTDLVTTESSAELERLRGLVPPELTRLLRVRGLGPKRVRMLWRELGVESPAQLKVAAESGQVQTLRGFGPKLVQQILTSLPRLDEKPASRPAPATEATTRRLPAPTGQSRLWVGTSGYSYPLWKGTFYPADARTEDLLQLYAERLSTVEINNTFYRFPSQRVIQQWNAQTPDHFRFAIKAHRRFTHLLRLGEAAHEGIVEFVQRCVELRDKLGCILFQLPPNLARDDARLSSLFAALPAGPRYALEFRHASWLDDAVLDRLRAHNVACVSGDADDEEARRFATADFVYVRLHRTSYTDDQLDQWQQWFDAQRAEQRDVLAYLKHDETGGTPLVVLNRWRTVDTPARAALRETLAAPAASRTRRQRKSG